MGNKLGQEIVFSIGSCLAQQGHPEGLSERLRSEE